MRDRKFLEWLWHRLEDVHGDDRGADYMHKLWSIMQATPPDKNTPNTGRVSG